MSKKKNANAKLNPTTPPKSEEKKPVRIQVSTSDGSDIAKALEAVRGHAPQGAGFARQTIAPCVAEPTVQVAVVSEYFLTQPQVDCKQGENERQSVTGLGANPTGLEPEQLKGRFAPPFPSSFGYGIVVFGAPFWEGDHFDAGEHVVFDGD